MICRWKIHKHAHPKKQPSRVDYFNIKHDQKQVFYFNNIEIYLFNSVGVFLYLAGYKNIEIIRNRVVQYAMKVNRKFIFLIYKKKGI